MSTKTITRIECDCVLDGEKCETVFLIPYPAEGEVEGLENLVKLDMGGREFYFCGMVHLIAFSVAWIKANAADTKQESRAHVAMEELEDLNLRD